MPPFSAARRRKNVATAEGRGKAFIVENQFFDGCALSRLHSRPLIAPSGAKDCRA